MKNLKLKIDSFLWAIIWLLPILAFFISWYRVGSAPQLFTFIDEQFAFGWVQDLINNVWNTAFGENLPLSGFLSYLIGVEVAHCLFDAVVFIPRFAHNLIEKGEKICSRD